MKPIPSTKLAIFAEVWRKNVELAAVHFTGSKTKVGTCCGKKNLCLTATGVIP